MNASPFPSVPVPEIPLPEAPLVRVIAQIRFSTIASLTSLEFIAPFQQALRVAYPTMEEERALKLVIGPEGVSQAAGDRQWRLSSEDQAWAVVLGPAFVSLETRSYLSRSDFVARVADMAGALNSIIGDVPVMRLGVRYIDRLLGDRAALPQLVRQEALGLTAVDLGGAEIRESVSQAEFSLTDGSTMTSRWGLLPPGSTMTPDVEPVEETSWVLDLDVSTNDLRLTDNSVRDAAIRLCGHAYDFFRWMTTKEFILLHGGTVE